MRVTKAEVIKTASDMADRNGLHNVSLKAIAENLGIRTPSLYNHIGSLDELLREIAHSGMRTMNEKMIRALGVNTDHMKLVALALSNGFIALSGSLVAQNQKVADVGSGTGAIVIGLASIVIGEVLFAKATSFKWRLTGIIVGSIVYRMIVAIVLQLGMRSSDLKLLTAILVAVALSVPRLLQVKNGKGARS